MDDKGPVPRGRPRYVSYGGSQVGGGLPLPVFSVSWLFVVRPRVPAAGGGRLYVGGAVTLVLLVAAVVGLSVGVRLSWGLGAAGVGAASW